MYGCQIVYNNMLIVVKTDYNNMKKFIFDVDGTLTESRNYMDISFMSEFIIFCCKFDTYLVTGSDRDKTVEQVGLDVYNRAKRVFNCSGADIYEKNFII